RLYDFPPDLARPWVKVNFISSADGAVTVGGRSGGLSDPNDKKIFALGRTLADVILVGAGTAMIERYRGIRPDEVCADVRAELGLAPLPPIAVVTRRCTVTPDSPLVTKTATPTIVFTSVSAPAERRKALADAGADVVIVGDDDVDLAAALRDLDRRALRRVCCEGGPRLFGTLAVAGLVDELDLSIAPLLAVGDAGRITAGPLPATPTRLRLASVLHADDMLLLRYLRAADPR
ncbi:MAG TPA: dihydrofolate reductase family protein, partial [Pseudonocardiaceae bacterium]|nr:dihydrofolate reductase family protein [Pseudonocardiaceae bacterium]